MDDEQGQPMPPEEVTRERKTIWSEPVTEPWRARPVFWRSLDLLGIGFPVYFVLALPTALLAGAATSLAVGREVVVAVVLQLGSAFVGFIATLLMIAATDVLRTGNRPSFGSLGRVVTRRAIPLVALYVGLALVVAGVIVATVLFTATAPAITLVAILVIYSALIYGVLRLAPVAQVVVLEGLGGRAALGRSWRLTDGHVWRLVRLGILMFLVTLPASIGAELLASLTSVPALASITPAVSAFLSTPLFAISTTLAWAEMADRSEPAEGVGDGDRPRGLVLGVVVGLGIVLAVAGVVEGVRTGGAAVVGDRGVILAGTDRNPVDPCRPVGPKSSFSVGEPIHIGGYFSRRLLPGREATIQIYVDGDLAASEPLAAGPLGTECYYELEPLTDVGPSEWRIVVVDEGESLAEGSFSIR